MAEGVVLKRVPIEEKPLLWKLLQEYLNLEPFRGAHHFKDEEGNWKYPYFDGYWTKETRHPFFIYYQDELAGFVMVRELTPTFDLTINKGTSRDDAPARRRHLPPTTAPSTST